MSTTERPEHHGLAERPVDANGDAAFGLLEALCERAASGRADFSEHVRELLRIGCRSLDMDAGLVTRNEGGACQIGFAVSPAGLDIREGTRCELRNPHCADILETRDLIARERVTAHEGRAGDDRMLDDVGRCIGAPVLIEGRVEGTVLFVGRRPRSAPFSEMEIASVRLLARWVGEQLERAAIESTLRSRERRFHEFVKRTPAAVAVVDRQMRYLAVSDRWCSDYGLRDTSLVGRSHYEVFPEVPEHWKEIHSRCMAGRVESNSGERFDRADGSTDWVRWEVHPWRNDDGEIGGLVMFTEVITQQKEREDALRRAAMHDRLTGLPNREYFLAQVERSMERARRRCEEGFALLFLDFDRFKVINDSLGHEVGDQLLQAISHRLESTLRGSDLAARGEVEHTSGRIGGDEFVVLLEGVSTAEEAARAAGRLQQILGESHCLAGHELVSTASVGAVVYSPRYDRAEDMLRDADTAMYRAKRAGRDQVVVFDEHMHDEAMERLEIEEDLRRALDRDEVGVALQPIISLADSGVCGFEALMRWTPEGRGVVDAGRFLPVAIETGLIGSMSLRALGHALEWFRVWSESRIVEPGIMLNVNLAHAQINSPRHVDDIISLVRSSAVDPQRIELEIAAGAADGEVEGLISALRSFRDEGLRIAFTEFGGSTASLYHLHRFPIDTVKIGREQVATMSTRSALSAVSHAVISLAHNLGLRVIAEGVETKDQLAHLQALDCDAAQGWFFSKALTPQEAGRFARRQRALLRKAS